MKAEAVLLSAMALAAATNVFAGNDNGPTCAGNGSCSTTNYTTHSTVNEAGTATAVSAGGSATSVSAGGAGGTGGSSSAAGGAANATGGKGGSATGGSSSAVSGNNVISTTVQGDSHPDQIKTTGFAPTIYSSPTAPCRISVGISGGWMGGAAGFSSSVLDEGCDAHRDAAGLVAIGEKEAAIARLCMKKEIAQALGPKCPGFKQPVAQEQKKTFTTRAW